MRPASNFTATASTGGGNNVGFWHWDSPMPYLFGGLAVMLCIITVALIILACSYKKSLSRNEGNHQEQPCKQVEIEVDSEPKIVVIMAGDHNPTFLAKPQPASFPCRCQKNEQGSV